MKGYHYTSYENWQKIEKQGLRPYKIHHSDIRKYIPYDVYGIFTWVKDHEGQSHIGNILFQKSTKNSNRIVKLCFEYDEEDILHYNGALVKLFHYGEITGSGSGGEVTSSYHTGQPAYIITRKIDPKKIKLVGDYNLIELFKDMNEKEFDDYVEQRDWMYKEGFKAGVRKACWIAGGLIAILLAFVIIR